MGSRNRLYTGLVDAAYSLEEQAAGRNLELSRVLFGAIALDTLFRRNALDTDLQDAALLLERFVTRGTWHLDAGGKSRAARLATIVRVFANRYAEKSVRGG